MPINSVQDTVRRHSAWQEARRFEEEQMITFWSDCWISLSAAATVSELVWDRTLEEAHLRRDSEWRWNNTTRAQMMKQSWKILHQYLMTIKMFILISMHAFRFCSLINAYENHLVQCERCQRTEPTEDWDQLCSSMMLCSLLHSYCCQQALKSHCRPPRWAANRRTEGSAGEDQSGTSSRDQILLSETKAELKAERTGLHQVTQTPCFRVG